MKKKLLLMLMLVLVTMPAFSDVVDVDIKSFVWKQDIQSEFQCNSYYKGAR